MARSKKPRKETQNAAEIHHRLSDLGVCAGNVFQQVAVARSRLQRRGRVGTSAHYFAAERLTQLLFDLLESMERYEGVCPCPGCVAERAKQKDPNRIGYRTKHGVPLFDGKLNRETPALHSAIRKWRRKVRGNDNRERQFVRLMTEGLNNSVSLLFKQFADGIEPDRVPFLLGVVYGEMLTAANETSQTIPAEPGGKAHQRGPGN